MTPLPAIVFLRIKRTGRACVGARRLRTAQGASIHRRAARPHRHTSIAFDSGFNSPPLRPVFAPIQWHTAEAPREYRREKTVLA